MEPREEASSRWNRRAFLTGVGKAGVAGAGLYAAQGLLGSVPAWADPVKRAAVKSKAAGRSALETVYGWLPRPAAAPGSLLVVDLSGLSATEEVELAILQGLANNRLPEGGQAAYLRVPPSSPGYPLGLNLWPGIYQDKFGITSSEGAPADIAALAVKRGVSQYVIWDPDLPATINVANTLAWLHGTAAFAPADATGPLAAGMSLFLDLRTLNLATAGDAYKWAVTQLGNQRPDSIAILAEGDLPSDTTGAESNLVWSPRDYAVHARAFAWIGDFENIKVEGVQDPDLFEELAAVAGSGKVTMFGWSNSESSQTVFASRHGHNFVGADTPGIPAENLSVHNAIRTTAVQHPRAKAPTLDPDAVYASVGFTDGDNIGLLIQYHAARWEDSDRGQVPIAWSMQGMAPSWTPGIARYYFDSATPNDEFVAWLPFGYPDMANFVDQPQWPEWVAAAQQSMADAGLRVSQSLPHELPLVSERDSGWWDLLHGERPPDGHFSGYTTSTSIAYPVGEAIWVNGRPVIPVGGYNPSVGFGTGQTTSGVANAAATNPARPLFVQTWLSNSNVVQDAIDTVQTSFDTPVTWVLPGQLVDLQRQAWEQGLARTTVLGLPAVTSIDPYFLQLNGDEDSVPAVVVDGASTTVARRVTDGGSWTYEFNVEGCHRAGLALTAVGQGMIDVSGDGLHWSSVTQVDTAADQQLEVTADVSASLPAEHLWLRFTAGDALTVTSLRLTYNAAHQRTARKQAALAGTIQVPAGPNLVAGTSPLVPGNTTVTAGSQADSYTVTFSAPAGVGEQGYGLGTWITWFPTAAGGYYFFQLQDIVGEGKLTVNVWNGSVNVPAQQLTLSSTPQNVSLLVDVPASGGAQIQILAAEYPVTATLTPVVQKLATVEVQATQGGSLIPAVAGAGIASTVNLSNFTGQEASGTVSLTGPTGWTITPASSTFDLAINATQSVPTTVTAPSDTTVGDISQIEAAVTADSTTWTYPLPAVTIPQAGNTTSPPTMDGGVDAQWQAAQWITVAPTDPVVEQFGTVTGVPPQGGTVAALWDDTNLYILAQVDDDSVLAPDTSRPYDNDGVIVYMASETAGFKLAATVPLTGTDAGLIWYQAAAGNPPNTAPDGAEDASAATVAYLATSSGYNLALTIPWTDMSADFTPSAGMVMRYSIIILDRQGSDSTDRGQVMWIGTGDNSATWGYLQLA